jgi:hypothetical protein
MSELEVVESTATHAIAIWRNLVITVLSPGSPEVYLRVGEVQRAQARRWPDGLVSMTLLSGNFSALFSAESRARARESLAHSEHTTQAMAIVILVEGLLASATRTTMNALSALMRMRTPWRTFDAIAPAAAWLAPHIAGDATVAEIAAAAKRAFALPGTTSTDHAS